MSATGSIAPHSIHHINFPVKDFDATVEWYGKVFGMERIDVSRWTPDTPVLLMKHPHGNFDLHFTPYDNPPDLRPLHFCIEVEDFDAFLAHLDELGIKYTKPVHRPQNASSACYVHDPDGNMVEISYHGNWSHEAPAQPA